MIKHAPNYNGDDRTLCGVANYLDAVDPDAGPTVYAQVGESFNCPDCRAIVDHIRGCFKGYKVIRT